MVIRRPLKRPGLVTVKCDVHSWMRAYVFVSPGPFATVTGPDGSFAIEGLPPGEHAVRIWHETLGTAHRQVRISEAGAVVELEHSFGD